MIECKISESVADIVLNNPSANTFTADGLEQLHALIDRLNADASVRAAVISGAGEKFFSAGADLKEFASGDKAHARLMAQRFGATFEALQSARFVTLAAINGYAMGGGLECALACDMRICEEQSQMALPEASVGLLPCGCGTQTLPWLVGEGWAKRMILTNERVTAPTALSIGLVEQVVARGQARTTAHEVAKRVATLSPAAVCASKQLIHLAREGTPRGAALAVEREKFVDLFDGPDQREGTNAFLEKRKPVWRGVVDIQSEVRNHIAWITLNRPAALNALSLGMVEELHGALARIAGDPQCHALIIRGAGERAFCAGGDIRALYEGYKASGVIDLGFFEREYPLDYLLRFFPKPYLALLDGIVMGGGMGLSQGATWRLVGDRTRMAMPEVGIGFFPDVGGSYFLSRLPGALGQYLALTGNQIRAADAIYAGLADHYLASDAVAGLPAALDTLAWGSAAEHAGQMDRLICALATSPGDAPLAAMRPAIDEHFSASEVPRVIASLEAEHRPQFAAWAQATCTILRGRSPTMLAVAARQLERGRDMDFADCLRMEIGMVRQCYAQGDFLEGVRALVIDKDNKPRWRPGTIEEVTPVQIDAIFRNPWEDSVHPLAHIEGVLAACK